MLPFHSSPIKLSHHRKASSQKSFFLTSQLQYLLLLAASASRCISSASMQTLELWNIAHFLSCLQALSMLLPAGGLAGNLSAAEAPGLVADSGTAVLEGVRGIVGQGLQDLTENSMTAVG
jgi:hypothetical protein